MAKVQLPPASPWTYEDLPDVPDDGRRWEIIGGSLIVSPSPVLRHQLVVRNLTILLSSAQTEATAVVPSPWDWRYNTGDVVIPDLTVVRREDIDPDGPLREPAVPLLIVEVLSPSNRSYDLLYKRDLYERLGVPTYWIVDPVGPSLTALRLNGDAYETEFEGGGEFSTDRPFPVRLDVAKLAEA